MKSMFRSLLSEGGCKSFPLVNHIWKAGVPSKVAIFNWLVIKGKVNSHDFLQKRNPQLALSPGW